MGNLSQVSFELVNHFALTEVALELYYGRLGELLSKTNSTTDKLTDKLTELAQVIDRLREQAKKIQAVAQKTESLLPKLMDALGSDKGGADCPDSDPRRIEFFRLWNQPVVIPAEWQNLAERFSQMEKAAFARRLALRAHRTGLHGHRILQLQCQSFYLIRP
jgi:hypothetical protein